MTMFPINPRHAATLFLLALAAPSANAATYYVSHSTGDDKAAGTAEKSPWKTLSRASVECKPGDKILLKCGDVWNDVLRPKGNGTPTNPIVISSYGEGKRPLIDRDDYKKDLTGIHLADQEGIKISGLEFAHCMTGIYSEYSVGCPNKKSLVIENCLFRDSLHYQPYQAYPKKKIGLGICLFSHETKNVIVASDITVKNCDFRRLASGVWTNSPDNFNKSKGNIYNFANFTIEDCTFEEGYQWQQGMRGVNGGLMRNCITLDIGRNFRSFNGVAGSMFFRCKNWLFEDCEWGFISIGNGSGDGEAFDFEGNCDDMTMRNCLFHDTDGPGFLLCCYASGPEAHKNILMVNCVVNGKSKRLIRPMVASAIFNTTDWNECKWKDCRIYLTKNEVVMHVADPEKDKRSSFVNVVVRKTSDACKPSELVKAKTSTGKDGADAWTLLEFPGPTAVNEFKLKEGPESKISRYAIECWDDKAKKWTSCFNGIEIGAEFIATIVPRTTTKARLRVSRTNGGDPVVAAFEAYNDTTPGRNLDSRGK